jgi:putative ABC transport system permease protein
LRRRAIARRPPFPETRTMLALVPLIFRNVLRNRRRTILTLASSAVSLGLLALLLNIYQAFFFTAAASPTEALRLVCRHKVSIIQPLLVSQKKLLADKNKFPGVDKVSSYTWFQGTYIKESNFFARLAVDADTIFDIYNEWTMPEEQKTAFKTRKTAAAVGSRIARQYNLKIGQTITIVGDIYPVTLELYIAAIFEGPAASDMLVFHTDYLSDLLPKDDPARDVVGSYIVLTNSAANAPRIAREIDDFMAKNTSVPTRTESEQEFARSFLSILGNIQLFLVAICAAVTFTIMLVSANAVAMAVRERTREVAILRTLGFRRVEILQLVLGESVATAFVGGLLGIAIGFLITKVVESIAAFLGLPTLQWQSALVVLAAAVTVGFVAALVPALVAARKNIVESLRFTG